MRLTNLLTHIKNRVTSRMFVSRTRNIMILPTIRQGILSRMSRIAYNLTTTFLVNTRFKRTNLRNIRSTHRRTLTNEISITIRHKGHITRVNSNRVPLLHRPYKRRIVMKSRMTTRVTRMLHNLNVVLPWFFRIFIPRTVDVRADSFNLKGRLMRSRTRSMVLMFINFSLQTRFINQLPSLNNRLLLVRSCTPYFYARGRISTPTR